MGEVEVLPFREGRRDGSGKEEGRVTSPERGEEDFEEVGVSGRGESVVSVNQKKEQGQQERRRSGGGEEKVDDLVLVSSRDGPFLSPSLPSESPPSI